MTSKGLKKPSRSFRKQANTLRAQKCSGCACWSRGSRKRSLGLCVRRRQDRRAGPPEPSVQVLGLCVGAGNGKENEPLFARSREEPKVGGRAPRATRALHASSGARDNPPGARRRVHTLHRLRRCGPAATSRACWPRRPSGPPSRAPTCPPTAATASTTAATRRTCTRPRKSSTCRARAASSSTTPTSTSPATRSSSSAWCLPSATTPPPSRSSSAAAAAPPTARPTRARAGTPSTTPPTCCPCR